MKKLAMKLTKTATMLICSLILMGLGLGCDAKICLYPLAGEHIINVQADEEFTVPRDGYFLSNEYFKKVLKAQIREF